MFKNLTIHPSLVLKFLPKVEVLNAPSPSQMQVVVGIASPAVSTVSKMPGILRVQDLGCAFSAQHVSKSIQYPWKREDQASRRIIKLLK